MRQRTIGYRCAVLGLVVTAILLGSSSRAAAAAISLWYNGDFNLATGLSNERNTATAQSSVYDNFAVLDPSGWDVTQVFSNDLVVRGTGFSSADFTIRQGVSEGNGGVVVASGTGVAANLTPTGRTSGSFIEDTVTISGLNIHLAAGTYWLNVTPVGTGVGRFYVSATNGANAVGSPQGNDGLTFWDSSTFGHNFCDVAADVTSSCDAQLEHDFSQGIIGTVSTAAAVPEPASLILFGTGAIAILRRRKLPSVA